MPCTPGLTRHTPFFCTLLFISKGPREDFWSVLFASDPTADPGPPWGHGGTRSGTRSRAAVVQRSGCCAASCIHARPCKQVCPGVCTTKGQLNASPTEQAGSVSRRPQPGWSIVEKGCLSRNKKGCGAARGGGGGGQHTQRTQERLAGASVRSLNCCPIIGARSHPPPPAASSGKCVCASVCM